MSWHDELQARIERAVAEAPPLSDEQQRVVRAAFATVLDEYQDVA